MELISLIDKRNGKQVDFTPDAWKAIKDTVKEKNYQPIRTNIEPPPEVLAMNGTDVSPEVKVVSKGRSKQNKEEK